MGKISTDDAIVNSLRKSLGDDVVNKALGRDHLIPKKTTITREGKTFQQTVYISPEDDNQLAGVIKRYTTGVYKIINAQADAYLSGTPKDKAFSETSRMLFDAVESSTQSFKTLYRIEYAKGFKVTNGKVVQSPFKEGQKFVWGLRSTSKDEKFISRAAAGKDKNVPFVGGSNIEDSVVFRLQNQTGLDVTDISPYKQSEVIVSGEYSVLNSGVVAEIGGKKVIMVDVTECK